MRARHLLLLLALLPLLGGRALGDDRDDAVEQKKKDLLFHLHVHQAIDRGAVWLAGKQQRDGSFDLEEPALQQGPTPPTRYGFGESALATYTLAHCGYTPDRIEIRRALSYLRKHYRSTMKGDFQAHATSYSLSLAVLALHTLHPDDKIPGWASAMMKDICAWLLEHRSDKGLFRYPGGLEGGPGRPGPGPGRGGPGGRGGGPPGGAGGPPMGAMPGADITGPEDLSNTQYVLLALWAGTRHGFEIDPDVLESMADRLLAWQEADGPRVQRRWDPPRAPTATGYHTVDRPAGAVDRARGFGYTPGERPTGSMTTAGLSSLAILKAMLVEKGNLDPKLRMRIDTGIWDAIAWLARHFSVGENPNAGATWHYYYLYGLERACVIAGKTHLGERDWYREGAEMLIRAQKEDGRWSTGRFGPRGMGAPGIWMDLLDSCFALLFLKRAALEPTEPILPPAPITPSER